MWLCAYGCSAEPGVPEQERYAHRAFPVEHRWRHESEIPRQPEGPIMEIWELSSYPPDAIPTPEQRRAAERLVEDSHRAVVAHGWQDRAKALADGFYLMPNDNQHFQNDAFLLDDRILDPDHPEFLIYAPSPDGMSLLGLMFLMPRSERGPQVGGPLTVWHYHLWNGIRCFRDGVIPLGTAPRQGRHCKEGVPSLRSPEMLHVWLIDRPGGLFATQMYIEPASLPKLLARRMQERGY